MYTKFKKKNFQRGGLVLFHVAIYNDLTQPRSFLDFQFQRIFATTRVFLP